MLPDVGGGTARSYARWAREPGPEQEANLGDSFENDVQSARSRSPREAGAVQGGEEEAEGAFAVAFETARKAERRPRSARYRPTRDEWASTGTDWEEW